MIDREKAIKGLKCCLNDDADCGWINGDNVDCPYNDNVDGCVRRMMADTLALLEAQEPCKVNATIEQSDGWKEGHCPKCGFKLDIFYNPCYCGDCGQAVKWDG